MSKNLNNKFTLSGKHEMKKTRSNYAHQIIPRDDEAKVKLQNVIQIKNKPMGEKKLKVFFLISQQQKNKRIKKQYTKEEMTLKLFVNLTDCCEGLPIDVSEEGHAQSPISCRCFTSTIS